MRNCRSSSTSSSAKKRKRVATVAQRRAANIRERRRMFNLNEAFDKLRRKVPTFAYEKRLSRIETLRLAITYISFMDQVIRNESKAPSAGPTGPTTAAASSSQLPATSGADNSYRETTSWWCRLLPSKRGTTYPIKSIYGAKSPKFWILHPLQSLPLGCQAPPNQRIKYWHKMEDELAKHWERLKTSFITCRRKNNNKKEGRTTIDPARKIPCLQKVHRIRTPSGCLGV